MDYNNLPMCSCGKEKVQYQCIKHDCPNFESQKYYCYKCCLNFDKHAHKGEEISSIRIISEIEQKWKGLSVSYAKIFSQAKENCMPMKHLLSYLDSIAATN